MDATLIIILAVLSVIGAIVTIVSMVVAPKSKPAVVVPTTLAAPAAATTKTVAAAAPAAPAAAAKAPQPLPSLDGYTTFPNEAQYSGGKDSIYNKNTPGTFEDCGRKCTADAQCNGFFRIKDGQSLVIDKDTVYVGGTCSFMKNVWRGTYPASDLYVKSKPAAPAPAAVAKPVAPVAAPAPAAPTAAAKAPQPLPSLDGYTTFPNEAQYSGGKDSIYNRNTPGTLDDCKRKCTADPQCKGFFRIKDGQGMVTDTVYVGGTCSFTKDVWRGAAPQSDLYVKK